MMSNGKFGRYTAEVETRGERKKGKASAKKQGGIGETLRALRGVERRIMNENVFARPNGLRENAKTATSCTW